jgi:hypothetical protein
MAVIATLLWSATVGAQENTVRNDTVWHDTSGQEIWCNGGHIVCLDGQFHWIGYDTGPQRPWKINLYTSDLARALATPQKHFCMEIGECCVCK